MRRCLIFQPVHEDGLALLCAHGVEPVARPGPSDRGVIPRIASCEAAISPDLGGSTEEALARVATAAARNELTALSGIRPATTVNDPEGWTP